MHEAILTIRPLSKRLSDGALVDAAAAAQAAANLNELENKNASATAAPTVSVSDGEWKRDIRSAANREYLALAWNSFPAHFLQFPPPLPALSGIAALNASRA